ncbi:uncharacterized protein GIQ15_00347 [Arthroderma uncinatum]|uniref:uncharacterized protein n=1 Tax=Arthroderma uncinatum TaxID=74035 RepID=UPI00144A5241|nr:uncharacterized protein GIQ15_00347 [Arthroderma uncinatum]KAF3490830.1 hypothetical protein GIQ15_00347 [Arthroderma uncinatum]
MDQVISLLTSSPAVPLKKSADRGLGASFDVLESPHNPSSDKLDDSLFEYGDFIDSSVTKRRKLSPPVGRTLPTANYATPHKSPGFILSDITDFDSAGNTPSIIPSKSRVTNNSSKYDTWDFFLDDPIICSSSGPKSQARESSTRAKQSVTIVIDDDDDDDDDILGIPPVTDVDGDDDDDICEFRAPPTSRAFISEKTARLLEQLKSQNAPKTKPRKKKQHNIDVLSDDDVLPSVRPSRARRPAISQTAGKTAEKAAKALEREAAKARREREKQTQKEEKQRQKEEREKQRRIAADIAEVNKSKVDKTVSVGEMIVDMSSTFQDSSIGTQTEEHMRQLGVPMHFTPTEIPNTVSWRRKVTARYNEAGHWEPCPLTIKAEEHVLCCMTADQFVEMAIAPPSGNSVKSHFQKLTGEYPGRKPVYLIEGLSIWTRKNKTSRNRSYQAAVLQQIDNNQSNPVEPPVSQPKRKRATKKPNAPPPVDEDLIEDALLQLQVQHSCLVHHTAAPSESAEWIKVFTEHISTIPYRRELMKSHDASFCMDIGQVKSGDDAGDAYIRMLQEVSRITAPIAYGVATQYPSVGRLVKALDSGGHLLLEDVKVCLI